MLPVLTTIPDLPGSVRFVREVPAGDVPAVAHPGWQEAFPWLVQGTTHRGDGDAPFDLGLYAAASPPRSVMRNWEALRRASGLGRIVYAHQVHGAEMRAHGAGETGLHVAEACDGHVTAEPDVLLTVSVADCVPVSVVDPGRRAVALLHAGWRGAAAGILDRGLEDLVGGGSRIPDLYVHLGPAICGACYEVGPEVFAALGLPRPAAPTPVDLRAWLAGRAVAAGVPTEQVSLSTHCTLCGDGDFFSHRGGDRERQVGFLGVRP
jgi:hypothetical protein